MTFNLPLQKKVGPKIETTEVKISFHEKGIKIFFDGEEIGPTFDTHQMVTRLLEHFELLHEIAILNMVPKLNQLWIDWYQRKLDDAGIRARLSEIGKAPAYAPSIIRMR